MLFDILPLKNNTARLIRVYGDEPCIAVPGELPGPGGEKWTLTELGDYCFSEKLRNLPAADALCRYEVGGDGAVKPSCPTGCRSSGAAHSTTAVGCGGSPSGPPT